MWRFQSDEWYSPRSILKHWPCPWVSRCIRTPPSRPPQVQIVAKQIIVRFCPWAAAPFAPREALRRSRSGRESQREGDLSENAGEDDFHRSGFDGSPWHHQLCGTLVAGLASAPSVCRALSRSATLGYRRWREPCGAYERKAASHTEFSRLGLVHIAAWVCQEAETQRDHMKVIPPL